MQNYRKIILSTLLLTVLSTSRLAYSESLPTPTTDQTSTTTTSSNETPVETKTKAQHTTSVREKQQAASPTNETVKQRVKKHLSTTKLKQCNRRQATITRTMERIIKRGTAHLSLYDGLAANVEAFYASSGASLASYDQLVATVEAQQATAQAAVADVSANGANFSCSNSDPTKDLGNFRQAVRAQQSALGDYRSSINSMIDGVKSVTGSSDAAIKAGE